jgi:hypothetical protein
VRAWGGWVDRETSRIDDAELERYEGLPGYGAVAAEIRRLRNLVAELPNVLPATPEDLTAAQWALDVSTSWSFRVGRRRQTEEAPSLPPRPTSW